MEVSWLPKEKPVTWHQTTSQSYLDLPAAPHGKDVKAATSCTAYSPCISSRPRKGLPLVAALATVSAVIFLAYLCSLSIRGRLSKRLFVRKLAGGEHGEENNETDPCVPHSDKDIKDLPGTPEQPSEGRNPSAHGLLRYPSWSGDSETPYRIALSLMGASAAPVEGLYRAARPHLGPAEEKRGEKRKERETDGVGRGAKVQKLEAPIHHSLLGPSVPHLDPELDSLVDSTLSEGTRVLYEDAWLLDDVASPYVVPSILESEDATPGGESVGQQSHGAPMPTSTISTPLLPGNLSTLDSSDSRAMSPLSFFESVLSEVNQSSAGLQPDDWLLSGDAEVLEEALGLMHSGTKYSMLLGSGGESQKWEGSREKISAGPYKGQMHVGAAFSSKRSIRDSRLEAVQEPADIPPGLPSTSTDPEHAGAAGVLESPVLRSLLSSSSTGNIQPGMPSTSIDPEQGGAGGVVESSALGGVLSSSSTGSIQPSSSKGSEASLQEPAEMPPGMPSTSIGPEQGGAGGVVESSALGGVLSSSSTGSIQPSSSKRSEASLQVLASQAQAAADNLVASRGWLEAMLRGVSEQLLRTHPFYRLPEVEPSPGGRSFSILNAGAFRYRKQRVAWVLDIFRQLLTKDRLTSKELEVLLEKTEQLYGYATTRMPVYNNTKSAVAILGRVFMVLDTLYCATEVLGIRARRADLWPAVVRHIQNVGYHEKSKRPILGKTYPSSSILSGLRVAFDYYRRGLRPPARLVVSLKLAMLIQPNTDEFQDEKWDEFRDDAGQWLTSIKPYTHKSSLLTKQPPHRRL